MKRISLSLFALTALSPSLLAGGAAKEALEAHPSLQSHSAKGGIIPAATSTSPEDHLSFRFNLSARSINGIDFQTRSSGFDAAPVFTPADSLGAAGPESGEADRTYTDGFVRPDGATDSRTAFFQTTSSSQEVAPNLLRFTGDGGTTQSLRDSGTNPLTARSSEDGDSVVPTLGFDFHFNIAPRVTQRYGISLSFGSFDGTANPLSAITQTQTLDTFSRTVIDDYDVGGIILPTAPYTGNNTGTGGVTIPNRPFNRETIVGNTPINSVTADFVSNIRQKVGVRFITLGAHTGFDYEINRNTFLTSEIGITSNIIMHRTSQRETFSQVGGGTLETQNTSVDEMDIALGFYLQGGLRYQLTEDVSIEGFGRYDYVDNVSNSVGPNSYDIDLSGFSIGAGIRYAF